MSFFYLLSSAPYFAKGQSMMLWPLTYPLCFFFFFSSLPLYILKRLHSCQLLSIYPICFVCNILHNICFAYLIDTPTIKVRWSYEKRKARRIPHSKVSFLDLILVVRSEKSASSLCCVFEYLNF